MIECGDILDSFQGSFLPFEASRIIDKTYTFLGNGKGFVVQNTGEGVSSDKKTLIANAQLIISYYQPSLDIKKNDKIKFNNLNYTVVYIEKSIYGKYTNIYIGKEISTQNI